jgi:hypothetical protein
VHPSEATCRLFGTLGTTTPKSLGASLCRETFQTRTVSAARGLSRESEEIGEPTFFGCRRLLS